MILQAYPFLTLVTAIGSFCIGVVVLLKKRELFLNKIWFFLCIAIGGWNLGYFFTMKIDVAKNVALFSSRLSHASGILISALFFHFIVIFIDCNRKYKTQIKLGYFTSVIISFLSLSNFVVTDLVPKLNIPFYPVGKIGYVVYILVFVFWVVYAHILAFKYYPFLTSYKQNQLKYFLVGTTIGFFGGSTCFPLIFGIPIHPFLSTLISVYFIELRRAQRCKIQCFAN